MGAKEANEQAYRKAVLDKLDRIIQLLTPPVTLATSGQFTTTQPGGQSGFTCSFCHQWVPFGNAHHCTGYTNTAGADSSRD